MVLETRLDQNITISSNFYLETNTFSRQISLMSMVLDFNQEPVGALLSSYRASEVSFYTSLVSGRLLSKDKA